MKRELGINVFFMVLFISLMVLPLQLNGQVHQPSRQLFLESLAEYQWMQTEVESKWSKWLMMASADPQDIDVEQYTLSIEFFPETYSISGEVTIAAETLSISIDTLSIDCHNTLTVDSLEFDGSPKSYSHADDKLTLSFDPPLSPGQTFTVHITYHGTFTPFQDHGLMDHG